MDPPPAPQDVNSGTFGERIRRIKSYEVLIIFVLAVLLALTLVVTQVVAEDARSATRAPAGPGRARGPA